MRKSSGTAKTGGTADTPEVVQRITNAPQPLAVEQKHRMRVYGLQMLIRVVCLFLAVLIPHPVRWVFVAGAVFIPYFAVLLANAGRDRVTTQVTLMDPRQIASGGQTHHNSSSSAHSAPSPSSATPESER